MPDETIVEIVMPQLGVSVVEGTIIAWRKHPGDQVEADEAVCDVATDKIDSELPAPCRGRIAELLVDEGETVDVGTVIATMHAEAGAAPPPATAASVDPEPAPAASAPRSAERPRHSPVVLKLAAEHGV
ncbi:MAG: biotin/lipoyl-containing protein [Solirubrobacteraceae bacterium]